MKKRILNIGIPLTLLIVAVLIIGPSCTGSPDNYSYNWWPDEDQDGFGDASATPIMYSNANAPANYVRDNTDCNDTDDLINPDATDIPDNNIDENCNGLYAYTFYLDNDSDGFGGATSEVFEIELGGNPPAKYVTNDADCDDNDMTVNILADEIMDNGIDDNCNGLIDLEDVRYIDEDGDGYGSQNQAAADGVFNNLDCDDTNPNVHPYAAEIPDNGIDDNCDGSVDE